MSMDFLSLILPLATVGNGPPTIWMPEQASTVAPTTDFVFDVINWICYFFFVLITILLVYFVVKYRRSPDDHGGNARGPSHNTPLEVTWTVLPVILVIVIFWVGFKGFVDLAVAPKGAYEVEVTANQWSWNFRYPNGAQSDVLVVPAGRPVKMVMRSLDVLHAFFVPDFRVKKDIVPGRTTYLWFEAPVPTDDDPQALVPENGHWLFCAEYCGTDHSRMITRVHVLEQTNFDEWLDRQSRWLDEIALEDLWAVAGPRIYARCSQCHTTTGVDGNGPSWGARTAAGVGPIWERTQEGTTRFTDGSSLADLVGSGREYGTPEDYLRDSILNPGRHLVQGFGNAMPTFKGQLNDKAIIAITGMMKHLDQFDEKGQPRPGTDAARLADEYKNRKKSDTPMSETPAGGAPADTAAPDQPPASP